MSTCVECGGKITPKKSGPPGLFCSIPCRQTHRNRRMQRGAIAYDLLMAWRFDRSDTGPDALKTLCKAAATWNQEDKRDRDGRRSGRPLVSVQADYPKFQSVDMV